MASLKTPESSSTSATDKWQVRLREGWLKLAILGSLWSGKLYGLEILRRFENDSDLALAYPLLAKLKADGLLKSEWVEADAGYPRKYYQLTPAGRRRAVDMAKVWSRFSASLEALLSPVLKEGSR
jgi:PadR family transcriptional regulator, regulatory protein PadR